MSKKTKPSVTIDPHTDMAKMVKDHPEDALAITLSAAESFFISFERSAKRWERIIYPGMILLVLLMAYGFYLVFVLSKDMQTIANKFDPDMGLHMTELSSNMKSLSQNIQVMSDNIDIMTVQVRSMSYSLKSVDIKMDYIRNMEGISTKMSAINKKMVYLKHMKAIDLQMASMNRQMAIMTANIDRMRFDIQTVSRPMSKMNSIMPF